jgi:predicted CxxxxCH...CXXCH cytochrome family protein
MNMSQHSMGSGSTVAKVLLFEAAAPAGTLKARNAPTAAYNASAKTCSGVYCHSSGQESPAFAVSPAWTSTTPLGCGGCHGNPPRYPSGGALSDTANGHIWLDPGGWVGGHILGLPGEMMYSRHGGGSPYSPTANASPMTCETCHYDTTDPASRGPSGFYWLDTAGEYEVGGLSPPRCDSCHSAGSAYAPLAKGRGLPLRHVNGTRDVVFDRRTALPGSIP